MQSKQNNLRIPLISLKNYNLAKFFSRFNLMKPLLRNKSIPTPRSLYSRFLLITILPLLLIQLVTTIIFFENHWDSLTRNMVQSLTGEISLIRNGINNTSQEERAYIFQAAEQYLNLEIYIEESAEINPEGNINDKYPVLIRSLELRTGSQVYLFPHGDDFYKITMLMSGDVLNVVFSDKRIANPSTYIFVMWVVGSALVLIIVSTLFLRGQIRSILSLSKAAESFGKGREVTKFKPSGAKEIRLAGVAFIEMKERIKRLLDTRTQMLAGVSHDLKTPLARIKLVTAMMQDKEKSKQLEEEVDEMEKMIDGYLRFTKIENEQNVTEKMEKVNLKEYCSALVDKFSNYEINIEMNVPKDVECKIMKDYFARALTNLIDNSARYAKNTLIRAQAKSDKFLYIFIDDDGEGIPQDKLEEVFQPFNRIDESRNSETGGTGLGLSIARDIIHKHGGEIKLSESHLGGLKVTITLPI